MARPSFLSTKIAPSAFRILSFVSPSTTVLQPLVNNSIIEGQTLFLDALVIFGSLPSFSLVTFVWPLSRRSSFAYSSFAVDFLPAPCRCQFTSIDFHSSAHGSASLTQAVIGLLVRMNSTMFWSLALLCSPLQVHGLGSSTSSAQGKCFDLSPAAR